MLLAATAWLLARESKELLIGEPAHGSINASIRALAESESCIEGVNEVLTVHLAPNQIVAILSREFSDELRTPEIERCVEVLEKRIRDAHPEVVSLFVKPQTHRLRNRARRSVRFVACQIRVAVTARRRKPRRRDNARTYSQYAFVEMSRNRFATVPHKRSDRSNAPLKRRGMLMGVNVPKTYGPRIRNTWCGADPQRSDT